MGRCAGGVAWVAVAAAAVASAAGANVADCTAHPPPANSSVVPTAMQGTWRGPFAAQGYTGTVKLYMAATSYVMDATVLAGSVTLSMVLPQCGVSLNVTPGVNGSLDGLGAHLNMSTYYVGSGEVPNRTPDGCLSFTLVNITGVVQLRSAELLTEVSPGMFRSMCVGTIPADSSGNLSVTTYVRSAAAAAPSLASPALIAAALAALSLLTSRRHA